MAGTRPHAPHWRIRHIAVLGLPAEWAAAASDVDGEGTLILVVRQPIHGAFHGRAPGQRPFQGGTPPRR